MAEKDFVSAYGLGEEALRAMGKLARQVEKQGGQEEDVKLLGDEGILQRVAQVLARAGQLTRKFHANGGGFEGWVEILLINFGISTIDELEGTLESWGKSRLATKAELDDLWQRYPGFLQDKDKLMIVGERYENNIYWTMTKTERIAQVISKNQVLNNNFLFALII